MKEETLQDVIKATLQPSFRSFCTRMWLDYSDEHLDNPNRLDEKEYISQYKDWLEEKYIKDKGIVRNGDS